MKKLVCRGNWKRSWRGGKGLQGKDQSGSDGFHPKVTLELTQEIRGEVVEFFEQCGRCPQQACTTMFFHDSQKVAKWQQEFRARLAKAFERVRLPEVWAWATHFNLTSKILRVLCGYFEHQWDVQFEGCVGAASDHEGRSLPQKRLYDIGWSGEKKCPGCITDEDTEKHR